MSKADATQNHAAGAGTRPRGGKSPTFLRSFYRAALARLDVLVASFGVNVLSLALPLVILQVYDRIIPEEALDTFTVLMLGIAVVAVLDYILRQFRNHITGWSAARFEHATGRRAVDRLMGSEIDAFEQSSPSAHLDRIAAVEPLRDFHSGQGLITISDLPFAAIFLVLIWLIGGELVFATLAVAGTALLFSVILGARLDRALRDRAALDDDRYNFIFQVLNGIHTVKGLGMEAQFQRRYEAMMGPLAHVVERVSYLSSLGQSLSTTFSNLAMVVTGALGSILVVQGSVSGGALIACVLLAGRAIQPLMRIIGLWVQSRTLHLAEERLNVLMAMPQEAARKGTFSTNMPNVGDIVLDKVTVHRGTPDFPSLSEVSLDIPKGAFIAVQGPVGGGKSTFMDLLAGLVSPDEGDLTFDGLPISGIDPDALRSQIGFARQDSVLYRGTIEDNLSLFGGRDYLPAALSYARRLGLDEVLALMPQGLKTEVGDTASDVLPSSVQQQIALVRVLAREPELLLLDEANSAFDMETDHLFRMLLEDLKRDKTIVMVTSRPSLLRLADRVIEFNRGRAIETGGGLAAPMQGTTQTVEGANVPRQIEEGSAE